MTQATCSFEEWHASAGSAVSLQAEVPKAAAHNSVDMVRRFTEQARIDFEREKARKAHEIERNAERAAQAAQES